MGIPEILNFMAVLSAVDALESLMDAIIWDAWVTLAISVVFFIIWILIDCADACRIQDALVFLAGWIATFGVACVIFMIWVAQTT